MSFMERANWKNPYHRRRVRIFIPLAAGLILVAGAVVALTTKVGLTAFGGAQNCPSAGATPQTPPAAGHGRGRLRVKGAERIPIGARPAASGRKHATAAPTADPATPTPADDTGDPGMNSPDAAAASPMPGATGTAMPHPTPSARTAMPDPTASAGTAMPAPTASAGTGTPGAGASGGTGDPGASTSPGQSAGPTSCPTPTGGTGNGNGGNGDGAADPNPNCTLIVPPNPLSARGLATPYRLTATDPAMGPCNEANINQSAFVQATIIDPATGKVSVYSPLVIDQGTQPAAAPVTPAFPAGSVVGIWFGFNGDTLTLRGTNGSLRQGRCVNGLNGSQFGQFAYCNAPAFFTAARRAVNAGKLTVPALGTAKDGMPCPSVRDFSLVDQDQSDNVTTQYLATANGRIAQNTAANKARLAGAQTLANPSDNALLDVFVDPALGCTPWMAPDLANNGAMTTSLALDELQAAAHQAAPAALVPLNNPMTMVGDRFSVAKTNLYRAGAGQPPLPAGQTPAAYCRDMDTIQTTRLSRDMGLLAAQTSPMPADANSLFTFLGLRLQQSFGNLNCQNFGLTNPVAKLQMDGNVVVGVVFAGADNGGDPGPPCPTPTARAGDGATASPATTCPAASPRPGRTGGRRHGRPPRE